MKRDRVIGVLGIVLGSILVCGSSQAEDATPKASSPKAPETVPASTTASQSAMEKLRQQTRARLDHTTWALELRSLEGGTKIVKDTVSFEGRTVTSERLSKSGYPSSNYSLNFNDEGGMMWETMQKKEGEGVVFWRGQLRGKTMEGICSQQPTEKPVQNFSFTATQIAKPVEPEPAPSAPAQTPPASPEQSGSAQPTPPAAQESAVPPTQPAVPAVTSPQPPVPTPATPQPPAPQPKKKKGWF